ncbi:MAG: DUF4256 domain-containing protein [Bacteroidales bacterium]
MNTERTLSSSQSQSLISTLQSRFEKNLQHHQRIEWSEVKKRLEAHPEKLWSLNQMEETGGEPDVTGYDKKSNQYQFSDCAAESPGGRRSICYDQQARQERKEHKPRNSAMEMADQMGIQILSEQQYRHLQQLGDFDLKTSSWILTPADIRQRGGALFCDYRYGHVFVYHNGAESYYAARGFRGWLMV